MFRFTPNPTARSASSGDVGGMRRRTSPCAASSNIPFGSPLCLSFEISPPKGLGVLLSIPPRFKAALFATDPCPSARVRIKGLFGATLSRSQRSEEHTSELQSRLHLVCRLLLEKKKKKKN